METKKYTGIITQTECYNSMCFAVPISAQKLTKELYNNNKLDTRQHKAVVKFLSRLSKGRLIIRIRTSKCSQYIKKKPGVL